MEDLFVYQSELLEKLKRSEKNYKKSPKDRIKRAYLETRLNILEDLWKEFMEGHKSIILKVTEGEKEDSYFVDEVYEDFEEQYVDYKATLKEALQPFLDTSTVHQHFVNPQSLPVTDRQEHKNRPIKLPTIKLPTFTGKYEEWQTFYDLFCTIIHDNEDLSPAQKLHYLKTNLSGEPELLMRNFSTTNANYDEAWSELTKRYNNKRFNCKEIMKILFTQKAIHTESATLIKNLVDTTSTCIKALKNIGVQTKTWDMIISYLVESKLDCETIKLWEQQISTSNDDLPNWTDLKEFLEARFRALEMTESTKSKHVQSKSVTKPKVFHSNVTNETKRYELKCALCSGEHYIYSCKQFGDMTARERSEIVQTNRLCFNCLSSKHSVSKCRQSTCCRRCGRRHHSLLHFEREQRIQTTKGGEIPATGMSSNLFNGESNSASVSNDAQFVANFSSEHIQSNSVLLATARVLVDSNNGCKYFIRALLDQGSQASFVTEATVQLLNLKRKPVSGWVSGVGERQTRIKHCVTLYVKSCHNPKASVRVDAYILRSLTTLLPTTKLCMPEWPDIKHLELADPQFATPGKIDMLLGAEVYSDVMVDGVIKHPMSNLLAQNTILGWVLSGRMSRESTLAQRDITCLHVQSKEDDLLRLFWEIENEPNSLQKKLSKEEKICEEYFEATTVRDTEGRYVVKLPLKHENPESQPVGLRKKLHAWTDSTIVLALLKGGSSRWNTFVINRLSDILNILDYEQWGHVTTDTNPADCASRGLHATELFNNTLWWNGPAWLSAPDLSIDEVNIEDTQEEEKVRVLTASFETENEFIWTRFSSLSKMLRVISYCRRWLKSNRDKNKTKFITTKEIDETLSACIKLIQNIKFNEEIKQLKSQGCVLKRSKLRNLCPIIDSNGILRVGGRIQQSQIDYDTQHPIILPAKDHLSSLIIMDAHQITMHGGPQVMLNYLRSKFWILRARDKVKKVYRECVTCIKYSKNNAVQLMGQLPAVRVKPNRSFRSAGVDYAGPINIRFSPGRGAKSYKGYICLFICMVTRAIHLEAVTDLTSKGFIAAFRRFTARRGHCQDLYSDNGTNFVGADKLLRDMFDRAKSALSDEIAELLTIERTTWHFIPPHAPNFGGLWEAGVRSTKTHLKKVIENSTLTYEELSTLLAQVEACLNSRPITVLSDDPNDHLPLTPGHFLVGESLLNVSEENYTVCNNITYLERWRLVQKMLNDFWNRWHKEYLVNLNKRNKWNTKQTELEIDDVVVVKEDNIPPGKWVLGRIIDKHIGPDRLTRVVSIKCKNGVLKRPVSKICILTK